MAYSIGVGALVAMVWGFSGIIAINGVANNIEKDCKIYGEYKLPSLTKDIKIKCEVIEL